VHRSNGAARPAPRRAAIVRLLATLAGTTLLLCGVAVADTVTTDFNGFQSCPSPVPVFAACGTVNGQGSATPQPPQIHCAAPVVDCWKSAVPGNIPSLPQGYDQQVVTNGAIPGAPAPAGALQKYAIAALGAEDEAAFDQLGHDVYGLGALQHGAGGAESRIAAQVIDGLVGVAQQLSLVVVVSQDGGGAKGNQSGRSGHRWRRARSDMVSGEAER